MQEYSNELLEAPLSAFGLPSGINRSKKRDVGLVTPDPGDKNPIKSDDKKPDTDQDAGKLLNQNQAEVNAVVIGGAVLVLNHFALR